MIGKSVDGMLVYMEKPCQHIDLIRQIGPMDEGILRYRCVRCSEFFIAKLAEITVSKGAEEVPADGL